MGWQEEYDQQAWHDNDSNDDFDDLSYDDDDDRNDDDDEGGIKINQSKYQLGVCLGHFDGICERNHHNGCDRFCYFCLW